MASELVAPLSTLNQAGLTVIARILGPTGTVLSSSVSCSETGTGTAVYVGNMPGGTAAGYLTVQFYSSTGPLLWVYQDYWTGSVWAGQAAPYTGADTSGTTTLLSRLSAIRAGNLDNLDAAISTRSTYAGGDTSGVTTLLARLTATRAGNLDNLDAAVSTRSTLTVALVLDALLSGHTTAGTVGLVLNWLANAFVSDGVLSSASLGNAPSGLTAAQVWAYGTRVLTASLDPTAAQIRDEMDANSGKLANLDATISSRSTLTAAAVYEELMAGHTTDGTYGQAVEWIMATLESKGVFAAAALANAPVGGGGGGATAADIWGYAGGRTLSTPPPTKEEIRAEIDANSTELAKIGTPANVTLAADLAALQAAGDPWLTDNLDTYPVGSAGAGMYRVVQTPGAGPVIVIPAPSATGKCVAFLNVLALGDPAAVGAKIKIFPDPEPAAAGGFIIDPGRVDGYTILEIGDAGYGERELNVDPTSGTTYRFVCERLGLDAAAILVEGTFDISTLKVNPV